ncbi:MAG: hypothetical protein Q7S72_02105 [Candidatus Taylorbacteria bacterium]|nr:hypothetical protein [Candidatus Taylorbacteria bacterium]
MLRKNKILILLLILFLIGDFVLLFFLRSNNEKNISTDSKIIFSNNDKKVSIESDLKNSNFTSYIQTLGLFVPNGVIDISDPSYRTPATIDKVIIYFEPTDQPWIWSRSASGKSYVSFDEMKEENNLILRIRVDYELLSDKNAYATQIQKDIEHSILFILTRHSTKVSKGLISAEVSKYVVTAMKNSKMDFIKIRFNN